MLLSLAVLLGLSILGSCATYESIHSVPSLEWDFIIVGGGIAGSVLANRLTENPQFCVLLIEAGPTNEGALDWIIPGLFGDATASRSGWNFTTTPQQGLNGRSLPFSQGHILGGGSSINAMFYTRGSSSDFDRFAQVTEDSGWTWENLQPYMRRHEKLEAPADNHDTLGELNPGVHGVEGKVAVTLPGFRNPTVDSAILDASKELGGDFEFNLDMNSGNPLGLGWRQSTIGHDGTRSSAATSYLDQQTRSRRNLHIVLNTRVIRVLKTTQANAKSPTMRTVEIGFPDSPPRSVRLTASKEVILSAGSIGTPRILLQSGIGDKDELQLLNIQSVVHNPSVGKNLSDHLVIFGPSFGLVPNSIDLGPWDNLPLDPTLQSAALEIWNTNRTGPYVGWGTSNHMLWARLPDRSAIFKRFNDPSSGPNSAHYELILGTSGGAFVVFLITASPISRGSVTLQSNNPFDSPLINPDYYASDFDLFITREGLKTAMRFVKASTWESVITGALGPLANATSDADIDDFIRKNTNAGLHPVSTASMSPRDANWGVVDPDLLVKKVSGLRIVDASIMPYVPGAHTQAPVYIIAERAADIIKQVWRLERLTVQMNM